MPFALLVVGLVLTVAGARNKQSDLFELLKSDLTGPGNFVYWAVAIMIIGFVGYVPKLRGISHAFLFLVIGAMVISHKGFFAQFANAIHSGTGTPSPIAGTSIEQLPSASGQQTFPMVAQQTPGFYDPTPSPIAGSTFGNLAGASALQNPFQF